MHPPLEGGAHHRLPHRDVDDLPALPVEVAGEERRYDRDGGMDPSVGVAVGHVDVAGAAVLGVAGHRGEARERRDERAVAGVEAPRPVLPEGGDEGHREVRVDGEQVVGAEPHPFEDPGAEVGDEDVAPAREAPDEGPALGPGEVDPDALLVLPEVVEVAVAVRPRRKLPRVHRGAAGEVEAPRRLDLQHLRSEGAEEQGAVRPGPHPREVEHPDPAEGAVAGRVRAALPALGGPAGRPARRRPGRTCPPRPRGRPRPAARRRFAASRGRVPVEAGERTGGNRGDGGGGRARLAEGGRGPGDPPPRAPEAVGRPGQVDPARAGMLDGHEEIPRPEVLLLREPRMVEHRGGADPDPLERVERLLHPEPARPRRHPLPDLGRMFAPRVAGPERRAGAPPGVPHQREHPFPLGLLGADDEQLAVAAGVEAHRLVDGTVASMIDPPRVLEGGVMAAEQEGDRLLHRHVEVVAAPGRPCGPAGGERGHRRVEPGLDERVAPEGADRRPLARRAPAGNDVAPPAGVDQGQLVPLPAPARAGEAERGDGDHHQPGVAFAPGVRVLERRRGPLPDREVRPCEQAFEFRPAGSGAPVEDHAPLVRVEVEEGAAVRRAAPWNDAPAPERVPFRGLDLDHFRAKVRQRLPGARSGEAATDLDDRQAFEPLPHHRPPNRCLPPRS